MRAWGGNGLAWHDCNSRESLMQASEQSNLGQPQFIEAHPDQPNSYRMQIRAMPWYMNVLRHLSMEDMDLIDQIERTAFPEASRESVCGLAEPFLDFMRGLEHDEIQAKLLGHFLKGVDAAYDTHQIWPTEFAGRVFQTLAEVVGQTASTAQRDAVMAAYQGISNTYDRNPLFQHVVQRRSDRLESDIRALLINPDAQVALTRVLALADRYGDVALPMIMVRLYEHPQDGSFIAVLDSLADEAAERRIEAVAAFREDFIAQGDPVIPMLLKRLTDLRPDQSINTLYDELVSDTVRRNLERDLERGGGEAVANSVANSAADWVANSAADWAAQGAELDRLVSGPVQQGASHEDIAVLRTPNAVAGAVAGLYVLGGSGLTPDFVSPYVSSIDWRAPDPAMPSERAAGYPSMAPADEAVSPTIGSRQPNGASARLSMADRSSGGWLAFPGANADTRYGLLGEDTRSASYGNRLMAGGLTGVAALAGWFGAEHLWPSTAPGQTAESHDDLRAVPADPIDAVDVLDEERPFLKALEHTSAGPANGGATLWEVALSVVRTEARSAAVRDVETLLKQPQARYALGLFPRSLIGGGSPTEAAALGTDDLRSHRLAMQSLAQGAHFRGKRSPVEPPETLAHDAALRVVRAAELVLGQNPLESVEPLAKSRDGANGAINEEGKSFKEGGGVAKGNSVPIEGVLDPSLSRTPDKKSVDYALMILDIFASIYKGERGYGYIDRFNFDEHKFHRQFKKNKNIANAFHSLFGVGCDEITPKMVMNSLGGLAMCVKRRYASDVDVPNFDLIKNQDNAKKEFRKIFRQTVVDRSREDGIKIGDGVIDFAANVLCALPQAHHQENATEQPASPPVSTLANHSSPEPTFTSTSTPKQQTVNPASEPISGSAENTPLKVPIKIGEALAVTGAISIFVGSAALAKGVITPVQSASLVTLGNAAATVGATVLAIFVPGTESAVGAVSTAGIFYSDMINRWVASGEVPKDFAKHAAVVELGGTYALVMIGVNQSYKGLKEFANAPSWKSGLHAASSIIATFGTALAGLPSMKMVDEFNVENVRYGIFSTAPDFPSEVSEPGVGLVAVGLSVMFTADLIPENNESKNRATETPVRRGAVNMSSGNFSESKVDVLNFLRTVLGHYNPKSVITSDSSRGR
jgi:hypothetical protein